VRICNKVLVDTDFLLLVAEYIDNVKDEHELRPIERDIYQYCKEKIRRINARIDYAKQHGIEE
jgi:hypothetical protein